MTLVAAFASAQFGDLHTPTGYTMHEKEGQCPQVFAFSSDRSDLRRDEQVANVEKNHMNMLGSSFEIAIPH